VLGAHLGDPLVGTFRPLVHALRLLRPVAFLQEGDEVGIAPDEFHRIVKCRREVLQHLVEHIRGLAVSLLGFFAPAGADPAGQGWAGGSWGRSACGPALPGPAPAASGPGSSTLAKR